MKKIDVIEYLPKIMTELKEGVLLTSKEGNKVNSMTIAWGQIGIEWGKMFFTTYIRHGRYTHKIIEKTGQYTINIPMERKSAAKIIAYCGSKSGRDTDKIKDLNLTTVDGIDVAAPAIKELPLTLECKVFYSQEQDKKKIPYEILEYEVFLH